jgi:ADP-ribose pyrophosphatase YjhB (NUDIX family)
MSEFRYCPRCATELEMRGSDGPDPDRPTCPNCGWVHYDNPTPTVQAWIDRDGEFLALRRAGEPMKGEWNMPGGFVEVEETGPEAIAREVREETGLEIETVEVIGIFDSTYGSGEEEQPIFDVAYLCRITGGDYEISDESEEGRWFPLEEFPEPAFAGERKALAALRSSRA